MYLNNKGGNMKGKISVTKMINCYERKLITKEGDYSNSMWLIRKRYMPIRLKKRFDTVCKQAIERKCIPMNHIGAPETKKLIPDKIDTAIDIGNVTHREYPEESYESNRCEFTVNGERIFLNSDYYDYIKENIPGVSFRVLPERIGEKMVFIFSENKLAGLLMPLKNE